VLQIRQERWQEAIDDLKAAVKLNPAAYQAYVNLGQALQGAGRAGEALATMNQALLRAPDLPELYEARARCICSTDAGPRRGPISSKPSPGNRGTASRTGWSATSWSWVSCCRKRASTPWPWPTMTGRCGSSPIMLLTQRFGPRRCCRLHREAEAGQALDRYLAVTRPAAGGGVPARGLIHAG